MSHVLRACPKCASPPPIVWSVGPMGTKWKRIECQCCRFTTANFRKMSICKLAWNNTGGLERVRAISPTFERGRRVKTPTKLNPCTCCDSKDPVVGLYSYTKSQYRVLCRFCGSSTGSWDRPDKATFFWNRADQTPNPSELHECGLRLPNRRFA